MPSMFLTRPTSHCDTSPLNDVAPQTVVEVEEGEEVRAARGALSTRGAAGVDNLHMVFMFSTLPTFHWDTSPLNDVFL